MAGETQARSEAGVGTGMAEPRIALCGIVRDETRAIVERLAHCKALGFTDFQIRNNESTDCATEVLQALDAAGLRYPVWPFGEEA